MFSKPRLNPVLRSFLLTSALLLLPLYPAAAQVTATGNQEILEHWNQATWTNGQWSDGLAPSAGKDYSTSTFIIRTVDGPSSTFGGDSLRVVTGGSLFLEQNYGQTATIGTLILDGGTLSSANGTTLGNQQLVSGNLQIASDSVINLSGSNRRRITFNNGDFTGSGNLTIQGGSELNDLFFLNSTMIGSHTGDWFINGGRLLVSRDDQISSTARVTMGSASAAFFELRGQDQTIGSLAGTGTIRGEATLRTLTTGGDNTSTTFSGVISNAGNIALTKEGTGTFTLSGNNTYTGGTAITAGTLQLSGAGTLGAAGANVAVSGGALLDLNGTNQSIAFTAGTGVGTVANNSGVGTSILTLAGTPAINGGHVTIVDNTDSSSGKVAVVITGNTQGMSQLNTYSGGTTVNAGAFFYLNGGTLGAGTGAISLPASGVNTAASSGLLVNGGTYANDVSGAGYIHNNVNGNATAVFTGTLNTSGTFNFRTNSNSAFEFAGSGDSTLSGVIGPTGGNGVFGPNHTNGVGRIIKSGTGTLTLSGNNLYTGTTTVNGGILRIAHNNALGTTANGTTLAGGTSQGRLELAGGIAVSGETLLLQGRTTGNDSHALSNFSGNNSWGGNINLTTDGNRYNIGSQADTLTIAGNITQVSGGGNRFLNFMGDGHTNVTGRILDGTASIVLTKTGTGTLTLSGNNDYTGATTISAGTLALGNLNALQNTSSITIAGGAELRANVDNLVITAPISITGNATVSLNVSGSSGTPRNLTLGAIGGVGNMTFQNIAGQNPNPARFILNGASTYSGSTLLTSTTINANVELRLGVNDALPTTTVLTIDGNNGAGSGRRIGLDMNGYNQTLAGLTNTTVSNRTQNVFNNSGTLSTLTINDNGNRTFSGQIGNGGTNIALVKGGTGTFTLSGNNTYGGSTLVSGGTLVVNGALTNTSSVTVASGGTLSGAGSITTTGNSTTIASGGTLAPGDPTMSTGTGTLSLNTSSLTFDPGSFWAVNIAGADHGRLQLNSPAPSLDLSGVSLVAGTTSFDPLTNTPYWILDNVGATSLSGMFANMTLDGVGANLFPEAPTGFVDLGGTPFAVFLNADFGGNNTFSGGNDILLFAIPEPSKAVLLALGLLGLLARRRR